MLGPHSFASYLGILKAEAQHGLSPELVMCALLVTAFVQPLALWQQAPTASYLGAGNLLYSATTQYLLNRTLPNAVFNARMLHAMPACSL